MAINPDVPEIEDVFVAIKETCRAFGIKAQRADEIEHSDQITDRILDEIATCEHLIADLSYERPNVYYEVGYAQALKKKPILYRRQGTKLHFDLSVLPPLRMHFGVYLARYRISEPQRAV